jgi:hypothetical protein
MGQRNVRVVVGQGDLEQRSLRAVLEQDDFDVVGEATNASQLARVLTDEQPDIVVLDDAIGIDAVELAAEIAPDARLVVVWPAAVMPIAGAVRVEPSEVGTALSATVAVAAGLAGFAAMDRPEWIERVKKDPATLREMLAARGALPARPSVTELQRRGHRLHPSPTAAKKATREEAAAAAVVPIGLAAAKADEPAHAVAETDAAAAAAAVPPDVLSATWNRRLGVIALGGAAAAGALMIALALGPRPSGLVSAEPLPTYVSHSGGPTVPPGGDGTQNPDGNGGGNNGGPTTNGGGNGGNGTTTTTTGFTTDAGPTPHGSLGGLGGGTGSSGGGGNTSGTGGNGSPGGPRANSSHLPGSHGTGKPGTPGWRDTTPGKSGHHNPHGGAPGHETDHGPGSSHGSDQGNGGTSSGGSGTTHGNSGSHANGGSNGGSTTHGSSGTHGNGHANGHASDAHGRSAAAHRHKR